MASTMDDLKRARLRLAAAAINEASHLLQQADELDKDELSTMLAFACVILQSTGDVYERAFVRDSETKQQLDRAKRFFLP